MANHAGHECEYGDKTATRWVNEQKSGIGSCATRTFLVDTLGYDDSSWGSNPCGGAQGPTGEQGAAGPEGEEEEEDPCDETIVAYQYAALSACEASDQSSVEYPDGFISYTELYKPAGGGSLQHGGAGVDYTLSAVIKDGAGICGTLGSGTGITQCEMDDLHNGKNGPAIPTGGATDFTFNADIDDCDCCVYDSCATCSDCLALHADEGEVNGHATTLSPSQVTASLSDGAIYDSGTTYSTGDIAWERVDTGGNNLRWKKYELNSHQSQQGVSPSSGQTITQCCEDQSGASGSLTKCTNTSTSCCNATRILASDYLASTSTQYDDSGQPAYQAAATVTDKQNAAAGTTASGQVELISTGSTYWFIDVYAYTETVDVWTLLGTCTDSGDTCNGVKEINLV